MILTVTSFVLISLNLIMLDPWRIFLQLITLDLDWVVFVWWMSLWSLVRMVMYLNTEWVMPQWVQQDRLDESSILMDWLLPQITYQCHRDDSYWVMIHVRISSTMYPSIDSSSRFSVTTTSQLNVQLLPHSRHHCNLAITPYNSTQHSHTPWRHIMIYIGMHILLCLFQHFIRHASLIDYM